MNKECRREGPEVNNVEQEDLHECPVDWNIAQYDDVSGRRLDPSKVHAGCMKELEILRERGVFEYVLREDARQSGTGKFIGTRWVKTDKGNQRAQSDAGSSGRSSLREILEKICTLELHHYSRPD